MICRENCAILDDGPTQIGVESTVLDLTAEDGVPVILRPGAITKEQLESIIPQVKIDTHLISETAKTQSARDEIQTLFS